MTPKQRDIYTICFKSTAHQEGEFIYYGEEPSNERELSQPQLSSTRVAPRRPAATTRNRQPHSFLRIYSDNDDDPDTCVLTFHHDICSIVTSLVHCVRICE
jgi:hypothetical protein